MLPAACRVLRADILLFTPKRGTMHIVDRDSFGAGRLQETNARIPLASLLIHQPTSIHMHMHPTKPHFPSPPFPQQQLIRLPHSPEHKSYTLLASCMHAGSRIVRLESPGSSAEGSSGEWAFSVLAKFEGHKSMNYGSDVQPVQRGQEGGQRTIVSTSFYDKLMCVWQFGQ